MASSMERRNLDLNVVIMEAKRPNSGSEGVPQALEYMGKYLTISWL